MINPDLAFPGKTGGTSAEYPFGEARDVLTPGDGLGTPLKASWLNDFFGLQQNAMAEAGVVPSGLPDTALISQVAEAMRENFTRQLWRRALQELGLNLVTGSFEDGAVLSAANDVLWYKKGHQMCRWGGSFPKNVPAASTPAGTGGFASNAWIDIVSESLRAQLASTSGASMIGTSSGQSVQSLLDRDSQALLSRIKARLQAGVSPWGQAGPNNILADSIGFGYFASYEGGAATDGGMFYHRWASILARMLSAEFNTGHYITCNPNLYEYGGDIDVMKRTALVGTWVLNNLGDYTSNLLVGQALVTTNVGDYLEYTLPATFKECWVYYVIQPGGGSLSITLNGGAPTVLSCNGAEFTTGVVRLTLPSNPQGACVMQLIKSGSGSGPVGVSAVSPTPGVRENGVQQGGGLNLFAAPGRRLQDVSESVIDDACNNAASLILALGFNDNPLNGSGQEAGRAAFTQRINWVIQYCNQYDTPLIVPDFSWKNTPLSFTRSELRRAADETGGLYIPLPDMFQGDGIPSDAERIASGLWQDAAHPSKQGHKWIAEAVAKAVGLGCASKNAAMRFHDYWLPLPLTATYANILTNIPRNIAAYRMGADKVQIRTQIKLAAGGNFPTGVLNICGTGADSMFWIVPPCKLSSYYLTKLHAADENTGVVQGYSALTGAGVASGELRLIRPTGISSAAFNGASSFEIERWEGYDNV